MSLENDLCVLEKAWGCDQSQHISFCTLSTGIETP